MGSEPIAQSDRVVLFGDLHVHTQYSPDAHSFGAIGLPDDAYRYGKGEAIEHANGSMIKIDRPLDFMAVTDHASYMGALIRMSEKDSELSNSELASDLFSNDSDRVAGAIARLKASAFSGVPIPELVADDVVQTMWRRIVDAAERHYQPGQFTTFIGYEWSSTPDNANLHRNVIFAGDADAAPARPLSAFETNEVEALWSWLEELRASGSDAIAVPHNSNLSDGKMFAADEFDIDHGHSHATRRMANEPIVEVTQIKGTSETHPDLSPEDEWADFELLGELMGVEARTGRVSGSYVREAYRNGLDIEQRSGVNPFAFGVIGSSDSHNASSPVEENNFTGKIGRGDGTPGARRDGGSITTENILYSASGLAGVWAEENNRESIFSAIRRREVYATSGPRITLTFSAYYSSPNQSEVENDTPQELGAAGVPMGGRIAGREESPRFFVSASRDTNSGTLERLQIVKGWLDESGSHERVFDVACANGESPSEDTHRCSDLSVEIDLDTCAAALNGADEITTTWSDETYAQEQPAFYYARVLEEPTCRWSTWDSIRMGWDPSNKVPATIQERAWSSPIWTD